MLLRERGSLTEPYRTDFDSDKNRITLDPAVKAFVDIMYHSVGNSFRLRS